MFTIAGDPLNLTSWSVEFEEKQKHFPGAPPAMAGRSDAMGPEPECVAMGMMTATGIGLGSIRVESTGGIYVHSISTRNYLNGCSRRFGDLACSKTCFYAFVGDGAGAGAGTEDYLADCALGTDCTDCTDCGPRPNASAIVGTELACNLSYSHEPVVCIWAADSPLDGDIVFLAATPLAGRLTANIIEHGPQRGNDGSCSNSASCPFTAVGGIDPYRTQAGKSTIAPRAICPGAACTRSGRDSTTADDGLREGDRKAFEVALDEEFFIKGKIGDADVKYSFPYEQTNASEGTAGEPFENAFWTNVDAVPLQWVECFDGALVLLLRLASLVWAVCSKPLGPTRTHAALGSTRRRGHTGVFFERLVALCYCIGVFKRAWRRGVHIEVDEKFDASVHGERSDTAQSGMDMADAATTEAAQILLAEAAVETKNPIVEVGINTTIYAAVRALTPCGLFSSGPSNALADALSSARSVQAAAKPTISETPIQVEMLTLIQKSAAASNLAPPQPHRHSLGPARPYALDDGGDTNLDDNDDAVAVPVQAAQTEEAQAQAKAQAEAAGERLTGMVRIRGGGCSASKPRAQAEPFIQDLDGPLGLSPIRMRTIPFSRSFLPLELPSNSPLAVEPGPEAVPKDINDPEPGTETIDTMPTEVVEPAAGAAMQAEAAPAEAAAETKNPIVEIGNSIIEAIVLAFTPRGLFSSGPSNGPTQPNASDNGDDANLDDIDDDAVRRTPLPPKLHRALTELDEIVIQVLLCGAIRLLCVEWLLMQPDNFKMPNRQALEALEKSGASPSPLLSREAAAALVRRGDRSIGALTYGWLSPGDPDPAGSRIRVLRRALMRLAIKALFWDFGSLYQAPRTPEQKDFFEIALKGGAMNQLYASILATTVLQIEEIPPRPDEFDGVVCLFELSSNADESVVRAALIRFGTIESCDLSRSPAIVRFALHESAVAAKDAGAPPGLCVGLDTLYNETPYFKRGW